MNNKSSNIQNKKQCNCSFCHQFYFNRLQKYNCDKKMKNNANETFTLDDLDNITFLKSLEFDTKEISKQTNLSHSIVDYVINIITWKM